MQEETAVHGCCTRRKTGPLPGRRPDWAIIRSCGLMCQWANEPRSALTARIVAEVMGELRRAMG